MTDPKKLAEEYSYSAFTDYCCEHNQVTSFSDLTQAFLAGYQAGMVAEREECAQIADALALGFHSPHEYREDVAQTIRAQGEGKMSVIRDDQLPSYYKATDELDSLRAEVSSLNSQMEIETNISTIKSKRITDLEHTLEEQLHTTNVEINKLYNSIKQQQEHINKLVTAIKTHQCKWHPCEICAALATLDII